MWIGAVRYQQPIKILVRGVNTAERGGFAPRITGCSDARSRRELQAVADTELGEDMSRAGRVGFELLPQSTDKHPQILHLFGLRRAPDLAQKMAMGQHLAGVHNEMAQQVEFLGGELNLPASARDVAA